MKRFVKGLVIASSLVIPTMAFGATDAEILAQMESLVVQGNALNARIQTKNSECFQFKHKMMSSTQDPDLYRKLRKDYHDCANQLADIEDEFYKLQGKYRGLRSELQERQLDKMK